MTAPSLLFTSTDKNTLSGTDGTAPGTAVLASSTSIPAFKPDPIYGNVSATVYGGNSVYFTMADSSGTTSAIWSYDGSAVTQITSSSNYVYNQQSTLTTVNPNPVIAFGNDIVFSQATLASNTAGDNNYDTATLAVYDTTTHAITQPTAPNGGYDPHSFVVLNGTLYFEATDTTTNKLAIYSYNGSTVTEIYNLHPTYTFDLGGGPTTVSAAGSVTGPLIAFNNSIYFGSGQETVEQLNSLTSLSNSATDRGGSAEYLYNEIPGEDLIVSNNQLFFLSNNNGIYSLSTGGGLTQVLGSLGAQTFLPVVYNNAVYFESTDPNFQTPNLYKSTGGAATVVASNRPASNFVVFGSTLYFNNTYVDTIGTVNGNTVSSMVVPAASLGAVPLVVAPFGPLSWPTGSAVPTGLGLSPSTDSGTLSDDITDVTAPTIVGNGTAGSTIDVYETAPGADSIFVGTATVTAGGTWSLGLGTIALGPHSYSITQTTGTSAASDPASLTITIVADPAPAVPTLYVGSDSGTVGDLRTIDTAPVFVGTGTDGDEVDLYDGATFIGDAIVSSGAWSIPSSTLSPGSHSITTVVTDANGDTATSNAVTLTIDPVPSTPVITSPAVTNMVAPTLAGTADSGDTVTVVVGGASYTTVAAGNRWTIDLSTATPTSGTLALDTNGPNPVTVTAVDSGGNAAPSAGAQTLTIDTIPPVAPLITSPTLTDSPAPVLNGTAESGDTVTVTIAGATYTVVAAGGVWSINLATATPSAGALALNTNGPNAVVASAVDPAGNPAPTTATQTLTIDTTAPIAPQIVSPALTDVPAPVLTGTAESGDTITVTIAGATYTTVAAGGVWSINLSTATPSAGALALNINGPNAVVASAVDPAGNPAPTVAIQTLTIDTTAPIAPLITSPTLTDSPAPVLTGTAESGDTVTVQIGGATYTTVAAAGVWSINLATATPSAGALALNLNGPNAVAASAVDPAGNPAPTAATQTLTIDTTAPISPQIISPALTNSPAPVLTGIAESGDTVTVTIAGATYTVVAAGGVWSINLATATPSAGALALNINGPNAVVASAVDPAGNPAPTTATQTLTIDTTAPIVPLITSSAVTDVPAPVLTGIAESGDTVTVTIAGATYTTVAAGGVWSIDLATATPSAGALALNLNGPNAVVASAIDPAGNPASTVAIQTLTIDTTAPIAPLITSPTLTDSPAPVLTGTAESGDTVTVQIGGATYTTVAAAGVWSINLATATPSAGALALNLNGPNAVAASAVDPAGNPAPTTATQTLTIDTTAPINPQIISPALTNSPAPVLTGIAESGDTVTVTIAGATYTVVAAGGVWSVDLATATPSAGALALNTNGPNAVVASAVDPAGNPAPTTATQTLTIDTTAPINPQIISPVLTNSPAPVLTGIAESGDTVTVTIAGATYTTVAAGGVWSINLATATPSAGALALNLNGPNAVVASAVDPAGNPASTPATQTLTIDTVAPVAPTLAETTPVTPQATPILEGIAEPGSIVHLTKDGDPLATVIATNGTWSFTFDTALSPGSYIIGATATDAAANVSAAASPLTIQVAPDNSYALVTPIANTDNTQSMVYDPTGVLSTVRTNGSEGQLLTSVTGNSALINIYDTAGTLIGTITQPSASILAPPVFETTPQPLAAITASGMVSNVVDLLDETHMFVSRGNDQITVHAGTATITATGPSTVVNNIAGNVTFYGSATGTASAYGGSGTLVAGGAGGGGTLVGGTAGHNILAAGGGTTTLVGAGDGDELFGSSNGVDTLFGGTGAEILVGGGGTETIVASPGDTAFGGSGQSTLFAGEQGGNVLVGGSGTSVLVADKGDTALWGGTGHSTLWGGAGHDVLGGNADINSVTVMVGGSGTTTFIGSGGTSTAYGGSGDDTFWTGTGAMTIVAGSGHDTIMLGAGSTSVTGGSGPDLYGLISGQAGGTTMISNFKVGVDQVAFYGYDLNTIQQTVSGGNTVLTAGDHSTVTLLGITQLSPNSIV